jgi:hypothetical protein
MMIGLGALVGAATIGAARRGRGWHWLAMAIVWVALQEYAAPAGPEGRTLALVTPVGALALLALGSGLGRRARWLPVVVGIVLVVTGVLAPEVAARRRPTPPLAALPLARPGARDVMLVVLDTVRADHLGAYGYARPTSPRFDALAREGTLFLDVVAAVACLALHGPLRVGAPRARRAPAPRRRRADARRALRRGRL